MFRISSNKGRYSLSVRDRMRLPCLSISRMLPSQTRIIFTTAFKQYAFDSYEVSALDFLLKPIRYQKFLEAAEKAREWFTLKEAAASSTSPSAEKSSIFLKVDGVLQKVELSDIQYVEGMKDYVMFHLSSARQPLVTHLTMKAVEDMLPPERFMRIHRSFIIGLSHISSVTPQADVKVGDTLLHVSEGYRPAFDQYLASLS